MPRIIKYAGYLALFFFAFLIFLYWSFPYDALRDRIFGEIERQIGGGVQVSAKKLSPHWVTGVVVHELRVEGPGATGLVTLLKVDRARARASMLPLVFGSKRLNFEVDVGRCRISGRARVGEEILSLDIDMDELDLSAVPLIQERTGLRLPSNIKGRARLEINRQQPLRSSGDIRLDLRDLRTAGSALNLGGMEMELPDLVIAKGRESVVRIKMERGTADVESFRLAEGDLGLDLQGKIFLAANPANYRLNLRGSFTTSEKLNEAIPFLFIVDSQRQEDGSYPLTVTGRVTGPSIKIGTFTVPM